MIGPYLSPETRQMPDHDLLTRHTKAWLARVIIGHGLCPFAKSEFDKGSIHYAVIDAPDQGQQLEQVMAQCRALDEDAEKETSLLIFPQGLSEFHDFVELLRRANALLKREGYEGVYQFASFHPDYCFGDASAEDPANYTNRSPYPMLHILREAGVEAALEGFASPENIPSRNIQLTQELGLAAMQDLLADCYK
ncbi:MAG: DUF1415 domain-containing protein [Hyphomonadaceae bacterium]